MTNSAQHRSWISSLVHRPAPAVLAIATFALATAMTPAAQAQTFQVLHNFTGGQDGADPLDGLTIDRYGNLYGTASAGGHQGYGCSNEYGDTGCGGVFELARSGTGWILRPLYNFQGGDDSSNPGYGVVLGPDGALYGVISGGCSNYYVCGKVFRLAPQPTRCASFTCPWLETVLHQFTGTPDGSLPASRLTSNSEGNMYGVTFYGGFYNWGSAFELSPSGGGWMENVIYSFNNNQGLGVAFPGGQLAIDPSGNLYGAADCNTTLGCFYGAVWELEATQGWMLNELYQFNGGDGYQPVSVLRDSSGNLYGTTLGDGGNQSAAVYELSPSNGGWNYSQLYNYGGLGEDSTFYLAMDSAGNLYGGNSDYSGSYVFKLTRSGNSWIFSKVHSFSGPDGDGPAGNLVFDSNGNLYGTTVKGGSYGFGVIWEITP
jgi:uncharacterized repeat protein (TIGR03803 family)